MKTLTIERTITLEVADDAPEPAFLWSLQWVVLDGWACIYAANPDEEVSFVWMPSGSARAEWEIGVNLQDYRRGEALDSYEEAAQLAAAARLAWWPPFTVSNGVLPATGLVLGWARNHPGPPATVKHLFEWLHKRLPHLIAAVGTNHLLIVKDGVHIDDYLAEHLIDGSIQNESGTEMWVSKPVAAAMEVLAEAVDANQT